MVPFGLTNEPTVVQALINYVLSEGHAEHPCVCFSSLFFQVSSSKSHRIILSRFHCIHWSCVDGPPEGQCFSGLAPTCFSKAGTVIPWLCQFLPKVYLQLLHTGRPTHCPHQKIQGLWSAPVLVHPDPALPFVVEVDAFQYWSRGSSVATT